MPKRLVVGSLGIAAYFLSGLFLFLPKNDRVPEGFKLSGRGSLSWNESTQTLTVYQETSGVLTITTPEIPNIVHHQKIPGEKLLMRVENGNPSKIYGTLRASGSVHVINPNGIIVGPHAVLDITEPMTLSTLDLDSDDLENGGENRFKMTGSVNNYGAVEVNGETILLGNFFEPVNLERSNNLDLGGSVEVREEPIRREGTNLKELE